MSKIKGENVLITGGANGIGKLMGLKCLQEGAANLIIWDINEENLHKTQKEFSSKGYKNVFVVFLLLNTDKHLFCTIVFLPFIRSKAKIQRLSTHAHFLGYYGQAIV